MEPAKGQFTAARAKLKSSARVLSFEFSVTSTGPYRSCAALLVISNPLKDLLEFGLIGFSLLWLVLAWFGWF